jgi:hypothetical protein
MRPLSLQSTLSIHCQQHEGANGAAGSTFPKRVDSVLPVWETAEPSSKLNCSVCLPGLLTTSSSLPMSPSPRTLPHSQSLPFTHLAFVLGLPFLQCHLSEPQGSFQYLLLQEAFLDIPSALSGIEIGSVPCTAFALCTAFSWVFSSPCWVGLQLNGNKVSFPDCGRLCLVLKLAFHSFCWMKANSRSLFPTQPLDVHELSFDNIILKENLLL